MTISQALNHATHKLSKTSASPALDAEVILSHILDEPKEYLHLNPDKELSTKTEKQFHIFVTRRLSGWPVPYLTNKQEFLGHKFYVDKNVLIPRPETEGLVELVVNKIKDLRLKIEEDKALSILDIGTGSGAIIVSLSSLLPSSFSLFASDISKSALAVAKKNAKSHKAKIIFKQGSLLKPWKNQSFDIIVANLPYLAKETSPTTKFEPKNALVAQNNGLALFEELFQQVCLLSPVPCSLFLEIGHDQSQSIKKLANIYLPEYSIEVFKDLSRRPRYAVLSLRK